MKCETTSPLQYRKLKFRQKVELLPDIAGWMNAQSLVYISSAFSAKGGDIAMRVPLKQRMKDVEDWLRKFVGAWDPWLIFHQDSLACLISKTSTAATTARIISTLLRPNGNAESTGSDLQTRGSVQFSRTTSELYKLIGHSGFLARGAMFGYQGSEAKLVQSLGHREARAFF